MNRSIKALILATLVTALFASMQISVLGAELASSVPAASSIAANSQVASSHAANSQVASSLVASSNAANARNDLNETSGSSRLNEIAPINENDRVNENARVNPRTGAENLMIPGIVAILAAATAAVTLTGKKK